MARTTVGILRGGPSSEYDLSLKTGAALMNALPEEHYDTRDIFVDKSGVWHSRGMPADPIRALAQVDVVLNAMHGGAGEDGTVQRILERSGVPYAGSRAMASSSALNKVVARQMLSDAGVSVPQALAFNAESGNTADMARLVFQNFGPPYVIKPPAEGTSYGVRIADTILDLPDTIADVIDLFGAALVEEFVIGEEATVGILEDFRNEELYAFPPAHVQMPDTMRYLHRSAVSDGHVRYNVPSNFSHAEKAAIADLARAAHTALGLSHYSNADIIMSRRGPVLLEVNTNPGLHQHAPFPHMLESVGSSIREFAEHSIWLARR